MYILRPTCTYIWYICIRVATCVPAPDSSKTTDILAGKEPKYDEVGRRIDRLKTRKDDSSSDEDSLLLFGRGQWGRLDEKWWTHRKQIGLNRGLARVAFFFGRGTWHTCLWLESLPTTSTRRGDWTYVFWIDICTANTYTNCWCKFFVLQWNSAG